MFRAGGLGDGLRREFWRGNITKYIKRYRANHFFYRQAQKRDSSRPRLNCSGRKQKALESRLEESGFSLVSYVRTSPQGRNGHLGGIILLTPP